MDPLFRETLLSGLEAFDLRARVDDAAVDRLERLCDLLLKWNAKVNLTATTEPAAVAELHAVDSLLTLSALDGAASLLDVGSGGGFPGLALACARPDLEVVVCDSVSKKVSFMKTAAAALSLRARAVWATAAGAPEAEGLPRVDAVVSRALMDPARWVPLAAAYRLAGGRVLGMLGDKADEALLRSAGAAANLSLAAVSRFVLPRSGAIRHVVVWR